MRAAVLALVASLSPALADCDSPAQDARVAGQSSAVALTLDDGRAVRLADVRPVVDNGIAVEPGTPVALHPRAEADRYGRLPTDVVIKATGLSLSHALVERGLALVDPAVMSGACLAALMARERAAEAAGLGLWADPPVRDAADPGLADAAGAYLLVAGKVVSVGGTRRTIYLNFGDDYRTDFTALIRRPDARGWADALAALEGQRVRVRGVVDAWNGAVIRVEHPGQIEGFSPP